MQDNPRAHVTRQFLINHGDLAIRLGRHCRFATIGLFANHHRQRQRGQQRGQLGPQRQVDDDAGAGDDGATDAGAGDAGGDASAADAGGFDGGDAGGFDAGGFGLDPREAIYRACLARLRPILTQGSASLGRSPAWERGECIDKTAFRDFRTGRVF